MAEAFLNVHASLLGKRWIGPHDALIRQSEAMAQQTGLAPALCAVLARLGVTPDATAQYLTPQLRDLLPDPRQLRDCERAANRLIAAIDRGEKIAIFADYDVDGGASAALLINWFRAFGRKATLYIPDRIDEGYGPNAPAMQKLAHAHDLIICVDCGTLSHEPIALAKEADILVLDHHLAGDTLPPAFAVVNPNRQDETGDLAHLCAAAVVFLVLVQTAALLRARGDQTPNLLDYLDLVALATVADVAPLIGVNRAFVSQGLKVMARRARPGLVALADRAGIRSAITAYHLGYVLGPRINAGGRIGQADLGAQLLSTDAPHQAAALAERLEELNADRRAIEADVRMQALAQVEKRDHDAPLAWASGAGWHPGVVGIVAARLKEQVNKPAIVIGFDGDIGKGSGRSIPGVDLGAAIHTLVREGFLLKGGGHKMAAGLTVHADQLDDAMRKLGETIQLQRVGNAADAGHLRIDSLITPRAADIALVEQLQNAGPFGPSAPSPRFVMPHMRITFAKRIGESHLKLRAETSLGATNGIEVICFGAFETSLGAALSSRSNALWHLAGRLEINQWGGRTSAQFNLDDAASVID